jgi:hypothetical protein
LYKKLDQSRPRQKTRGNLYYSLGKKRHKVKTQIVVNNQCIIIHKTGHKKGKRHDYNSCRYKNNHPATPENIANVNVFDLGYLGVEKDYPNRHHHYQRERKMV